jgi:hypothetical protein
MSENIVIPPGMPEGWTPPNLADVVIPAPHEDTPVEHLIDALYAQTMVRDQNTEELVKIADRLKSLWESYVSEAISKQTLMQEVSNFQAEVLTNDHPDEITIQHLNIAVNGIIAKA